MDDVPSQVGRYRVDRLLGAGAMGFVYLGRDPDLDRPVAIKTVRDLGMGPEALARFLERFRNEARAAARLSHGSIVQVYDVGDDPQIGPYLVFEYVAGATLKQQLLDHGPLDAAQLMRLADELAGGIDLAHSHGIIHRDIKPDNLLVTPDGHIKLADFGVARLPDAALTREGQFLGTPCYAAPETLDRGDVSPKSDLFSLAAVLYEACTGARAFPGKDAVGVAHKVIHDDPPPPSAVAPAGSLPPALDDVLMRGLSKDPSKRYDSARALADAVAEAWPAAAMARRDPTGAMPIPAREPASASGTLAFVAVLLGGLLVGVAFVFAFGGDGDAHDLDGSTATAADAGVTEPDTGAVTLDSGPVTLLDAEVGAPQAQDAGAPRVERDSGAAEDAGSAPDAAAPMTPHDREEAAKDALRQARRALTAGRREEAQAALERARSFDPENPDIDEVAASLDAPTP